MRIFEKRLRTARSEFKIDAAQQRNPAHHPVLSLGFGARTGPSKPSLVRQELMKKHVMNPQIDAKD